MRHYSLSAFGLEHLTLADAPEPVAGPGEAVVQVRALSLNYRDLMVVRGDYNPRLSLPVVPVSDAAGVVVACGEGVQTPAIGDRVMTHFVSGWLDGPYRGEYLATTLGTPGPGLAAERTALPAHALLPVPRGYSFEEAATLPIAGLTAWSALVTEGAVRPGQRVLTLGTGGVSVFAVQIGHALGAEVLVTSASPEKGERVRGLGATRVIDRTADWPRTVLEVTGGDGVDLVVENGGAGTLAGSLRAVRPDGRIALLGALTGLRGELDIAPILMRRISVHGVMVDSRASFRAFVSFLEEHGLRPVIDRTFPFEELPDACTHLARGAHLGKVVISLSE